MEDKTIKRQIQRFGLYGLFKNLKFFEPFLWLYFLMSGLSFVEIGILYSVRELLIYVFEIPSGVFADRFGKKNELMICFMFYISSFVVFFFASNFLMFVFAMVLYGLGEAFRSGTHKAMIMEYLEYHNLKESKTKIYGFTRSYSNIGSAFSSLIGIVLILVTPEVRYLFLVAIVPYLIDMVLISTYPSYLNKRIETSFRFKSFIKEGLLSIKYSFRGKDLRNVMINSAGYHAVFKTMKDYAQPVILALSVSPLLMISAVQEDNTRIILGLVYFIAYVVSVFSSKYTYKLQKVMTKEKLISLVWLLTSILLVSLGLLLDNIIIVIILFVLFYALLNIRKPYMVEMIGDLTKNEKRASVLSIESQLTSVFIIIIAPIMGYLADTFSISTMFIILGSVMIVGQLFIQNKKSA